MYDSFVPGYPGIARHCPVCGAHKEIYTGFNFIEDEEMSCQDRQIICPLCNGKGHISVDYNRAMNQRKYPYDN